MTQQIRRAYDLTLTPAQLVEALRSREVVERRCDVGGPGTRVLAHDVTPDGVRVVVATEIPGDWLPSVVRGTVTTPPQVERTEEWAVDGSDDAGSAHTPLSFAFSGMPVRGTGSGTLTATATGSRLEVSVAITVEVPFVGSLVESAVSPRITSALDAEAAFYAGLDATEAGPGADPAR